MQSEQPLFLQEILSSPHCHSALLEVRERFGRNCLELALEKNQLGYFQAILQSPHLTQEMIVPQASRGLNIINAILYSNLTSEQKLPYVQAVLKSLYAHTLMQDTVPGFSPLFIAVDENEAEIVQALLNSPHCTTELLKRQEKDDAGLTPLQNLLLRNRDERVIIEMFLKSPACTMDVLKMQYWGQKSCLKSLQEHDDWEKFKPYVVDKNKAFLESQMFMNVTNPKEGGDFINTVNSLKNLMFTVFEPLNDLLVPAFQQAIDDYNQNQDMGVFIQNCVQALTAAESELKNHQISFDNSSSESISIEELADDAYASDNSNESCYSSDSNLEATNTLELIKQLRNQIQIFESSLLQRIKTATQNYLDWCASHAQGHRFVTRFSHFFHGSSGQARAQRILNLINDGASYDVLKPHLDQVLHESRHRKHSYSRYLYVGIHDVPQDEVFELSDQDFLRIKHN